MEPTLLKYIRRYSAREQVILLVLTLASFPFLYESLELPKIIVNHAIDVSDFPKPIYGVQMEQVTYLFILCGVFLLLVGINGAFKYVINVLKGQLGERMLRRLRYQLFGNALRFPIPHFRRTSQGEVIAMITAEVEPLGGFIGDALAQPAFQGGTLITIVAFMFAQDVVLGLAAVALYPLQAYLIPKLQRQVNNLSKERVRTVRRLAERIGEAISGVEEIHANDTSERHRADFARWTGTIYDIRLQIYRKKFFIKFLNNFLAQLTPFFFFSIGGYLVIKGSLTFGALVAVLSAYKDLSSPWKELLDWYQQKEDARVKYDQLVEQFRPAGMLPDELQEPIVGPVPRLEGTVIATNLTLEDESGVKTVDAASFQFAINDRVALFGGTGSGTDVTAQMIARLVQPTGGNICIGQHALASLPEAVTGRRLAYVGQHVALINGSIRDNLVYSLQHWPMGPVVAADPEELRRYLFEAQKSGNTQSDLDADWIDYEAAGVAGPEELTLRVLEVLSFVELEPDLFALGLKGIVDPESRRDLAGRILDARGMLRQRLLEPRYADLVETFDRERYNDNMSVAENLLFGMPVGRSFELERLGDNAYVQQVLDQVGLREELFAIGVSVARIMVDLFQGLPPGHEFFDRFSFISSEDLPEYQAAIRRIDADGMADAEPADRNLLSSLPFRLVPARHRLGVMDDTALAAFERRIVEARHIFAAGLPAELRGAVAFFDPNGYNEAASVQDNILFGKLVYGRQQAQREVGALIAEVVESLDLRGEIVDLGLDIPVGIGGSRLSTAQRQKLAIARALIKRPDLLIFDQAIAALDGPSQVALLGKLLQQPDGAGIVWVTGDIAQASQFDRVIVMEAGRVVEQGPTDAVLGKDEVRPTAEAMG